MNETYCNKDPLWWTRLEEQGRDNICGGCCENRKCGGWRKKFLKNSLGKWM